MWKNEDPSLSLFSFATLFCPALRAQFLNKKEKKGVEHNKNHGPIFFECSCFLPSFLETVLLF